MNDHELVVQSWSTLEVITLPKAEHAEQTIHIKNLKNRPIFIQPSPGDAFADETHVMQLKAESVAIVVASKGKERSIWEFE